MEVEKVADLKMKMLIINLKPNMLIHINPLVYLQVATVETA